MPAAATPDSNPGSRFPRVAVLIATRGRRELLETRSLPSVAQQTRQPDYLVLIEDTTDPRRPSTRRVLHRRAFPDTKLLAARNARSPGVSGAWNTGLARLAVLDPDPSTLYVAILDDDDAYAPDHLASCLERVLADDLDLVAAGMWRHERAGEPPIEQHPPEKMEAVEFLVRSQHLQGSNLFVRLSILLEAGNFDEGQTSTTDRDVCTRLADLPKLAYARLGRATVHHHAEPERDRMSTPRSITRCRGLTEFHVKWRSRMSAAQEKSSRGRARELFAWIDPPPPFDLRFDAPPIPAEPRDVSRGRFFVASVVEETGLDSAREFVAGVSRAAPGAVEAIWLVEEREAAEAAAQRLRATGVPVTVATADRLRDALALEPDSPRATRPALLSALAGALARGPGDAVWFVRDDFAPHARAATKAGETDVPLDVLGATARAREANAPFVCGSITGDPLEIPEFGCRVELVDALHNLFWLGKCAPDTAIVDRGAANAVVRSGRVAWAHDASLLDSDRIERPIWLAPERSDETVRRAFVRLAQSLGGIFEGRRAFRRGLLDRASSCEDGEVPSAANLMVLDASALLDVPLLSPTLSDAIDARDFAPFRALQSAAGRYTSSGGIAVYREARPSSKAPEPRRFAEAIVADAVGAAFSYAMFTSRRDRSPDESPFDVGFERAFERTFTRHWRERERRVVIGWYRVRGLARSLLRRTRPQGSPWAWWWEKGGDRGAIHVLRDFAREARDRFEFERLVALRAELKKAASRVDARTASFLLDAARDHRAAMRSDDTLVRLVRASAPT